MSASVVPEPEEGAFAGRPASSHNRSRKAILRNVASSYIALLVSLASGFFVTPIVLRGVGSDAFAVLALVGGLLGYVTLADLGVGTAFSVRVARAHARPDQLRPLVATAFWIFLGASLIGLLASAVMWFGINGWFSIAPSLRNDAQWTLVVMALAQAASLPFSVYNLMLIGSGRADISTARIVVFSTLSSATQIAVALNGGNIVALASASSGIGLLGLLTLRKQIRRELPTFEIRPKLASARLARDLLRVGSRNAVITVAGMVAFTSDLIVLGAISSLASVTAYALAAKLIGYVRLISVRLTDTLMPVYAHDEVLGDSERQRSLFVKSLRASLGIAIPMTVTLSLLAHPLLDAWLGHAPEGTAVVLVLLGAASLAQLPGHSCFILLTATERTRVLLPVSVISAAVNLVLSVALTLEYGLIGPALGSLACILVVDLIVLPLRVCHEFGWDARATAREIVAPLLLATVVTASLALAFALTHPGPLAAALGSSLLLVVGLVLAVRGLLTASQRRALWAKLQRRGTSDHSPEPTTLPR